jgi:hypothetical protein
MRLLRWSIYLPAIAFPMAALVIGLRNQSVFQAPSLIASSPFPMLLTFLAFTITLIVSQKSQTLRKDMPGLVLFFLFFSGYFLLASIFNRRDINTNNIYFGADSWSWLQLMALESGQNVGTRAVHPLAPIIFRSLVTLISLVTNGNRFHANLILVALAGGGSVLLTWKIVRLISNDQGYAVLFASLLGLSASHLIFASTIESYIFSAFCLLIFIWLLLTNSPAYLLIAAGIATLGITITNLIQQAMTFLFVQQSIKRTFTIFALVVFLGMGLNFLSHSLYSVGFFFNPQDLTEEKRFVQELNLPRAGLMVEDILIYDIAAPQPYLSIRKEMPRYNLLNGTIQEYVWFGWPAPILWIITLGGAFYLFFKNIRNNSGYKYLSVSMLFCLFINFLLHIGYGVEPFLYSADWTYALILFTAITLNELNKHAWFKIALFALVSSTLLSNLWLIYTIVRQTSKYFA